MKKVFWVSALCIILSGGTALFGQEASRYYYVNVPIERIYPYTKGYVIDYRTGTTGTKTARTYLPLEWFSDRVGEDGNAATRKGDIVPMGPGTAWPYLTVYYKDGEFSHVRLYLRKERNHGSWGYIQMGINLDEYFQDVSDLKLAF
ncbi:MAG: hypothetical protein LBG87_08225 [Spirochaetaceae bacterium]|jgi:hypothetical protein|nr:hypothetical protein [Spirochaetaceae bacterium]